MIDLHPAEPLQETKYRAYNLVGKQCTRPPAPRIHVDISIPRRGKIIKLPGALQYGAVNVTETMGQ